MIDTDYDWQQEDPDHGQPQEAHVSLDADEQQVAKDWRAVAQADLDEEQLLAHARGVEEAYDAGYTAGYARARAEFLSTAQDSIDLAIQLAKVGTVLAGGYH